MSGNFRIDKGIELGNLALLLDGSVDPSAASGVVAPQGSVYLRTSGETWLKTGSGDTNWEQLITSGGASTEDGYQNIFMGKSGTGSVLPSYTNEYHVADNDSLLTAINKLDTYLGASPTPGVRTNNPIVGSNSVNANIKALDSAIGVDSDVTNTNYISTNSTLMKKASDLDGALNTHATDTTNPHSTTLDQAVDAGGSTNGSISVTSGGSVAIQSGADLTIADAPVNDTDAANKLYVDSVSQGLAVKDPCRVATNAALPANTYDNGTAGVGATITADANGSINTGGIDGITDLVVGQRVLVKNETASDAPNNGIYEVTDLGSAGTPWILTRTTDNDEADEFAGAFTFIQEGTNNADNGFVCTTDTPVVVGTTNITWVQFSGAGQITAGQGLTKTGNTLDVGDAGKGVQVNTNDLEIDASEIAGDGLKQASNSWQLDIEPADFAGNGLEDDGSDNLQVKAGDSGAANLADVISVESAGVSVKVDESTIQENGSNQLEVKDGGITVAKLASNINAPIIITADNQVASGTLNGDSLAVATYVAAEWLVSIYETGDATRFYTAKVIAMNDQATTVDSTVYAKVQSSPKISGVAVDVDISGGNMRLRITANNNINYRITRIAHAQ